ncbi:hypothetical protein M0R45_030548 [Rubus argutus]|uniref:Uncharacterized protein n=1 Tax=Rubus argutus TaxID=59490 RepID=A0AAW1WBR3_RUBAR
MSSIERPCFLSRVTQKGNPEPWMMTKDIIYIGVTVYKLIESRRRCRSDVDARDVTYQHNLTTERFFHARSSKINKSSYLSKVRKKLAEFFSGLGIPAAEQPPIVAKIMEILPAAYPVVPILVSIVDPTRCMVGSVNDRLRILLDKLQRDARERERWLQCNFPCRSDPHLADRPYSGEFVSPDSTCPSKVASHICG